MKSFGYIPNTASDRDKMMRSLGISSMEELFTDIPESVRLKKDLQLPPAWSEMELTRNFSKMAARNVNLEEYISFLGAGAYQHYIPAVVDALISRSEFYTAYTPISLKFRRVFCRPSSNIKRCSVN